MTVRELIDILKKCDQDLPVATHANNHTFADTHYDMRVGFLHQYDGDFVCIGNMSKMNLNEPNWYLTRMLDGKRELPQEWSR